MTSVFNQFQQVIDDTKPLWEAYLPEKVSSVIELAERKLQERTLTIQLYGSYNAGKSTLINVLLGENKAIVGEIPTTDHIDSYDWKGYKLLDSPGVNAPIEHEEVTLEELHKNDLIIFVIRQDDQDAKDIYRRIFACINDHKQVFIVLNYNGLDPNSSGEGSVSLLVSQINKILLAEAEKCDISELQLNRQVSILPINLKSALKGRLHNHDIFLEYSGFNTFSAGFSDWVKSYDDENHFVETIKHYLQKMLVYPIQELLKTKTNIASEQQALSRAIHQLELQRDSLINNASNHLRMLVSTGKADLFSELSKVKSEQEAKNTLEKHILSLEQAFNTWFAQQSDKIQQQAAADTSETHTNHIEFNKDSNAAIEEITKIGIDTLKNTELVKKGITDGLLLLRSNKIAFKGIWTKTFEKWATKFGPVVTVAVTLFEAFQAGRKEDAKNEQEKNFSMQLYQAVEAISNDIKQAITSSVESVVMSSFEGIIQEQKSNLDQLNNKASAVEKDRINIQLIADRLDSIRVL